MGSLSHSVPFAVPHVETEEKQDEDGFSIAGIVDPPAAEVQAPRVQVQSWVWRLTTFLESLIDHDAFPGSAGMLCVFSVCCVGWFGSAKQFLCARPVVQT